MTKLTFCGAAGTVTGSCSHIESDSGNFLVDCGLFQGNKTTQALNYGEFTFDPSKVEFLILTPRPHRPLGLATQVGQSGFQGHDLCHRADRRLAGIHAPRFSVDPRIQRRASEQKTLA